MFEWMTTNMLQLSHFDTDWTWRIKRILTSYIFRPSHGRNYQLPVSTAGVRSFSALLTRGFRRVGLDEGTCGGWGWTNGMDSFPSASSVLLSLWCINSENKQVEHFRKHWRWETRYSTTYDDSLIQDDSDTMCSTCSQVWKDNVLVILDDGVLADDFAVHWLMTHGL